ncbi:MAG: energy transducer TonB [Candidatus Angelobacter sp.]
MDNTKLIQSLPNGGYYVLSAVRPKGELNGSVLVTAQDRFFVSRPMRNSLDLLKQRQQQALQSTLTIDGPPREIKISNRSFARLDYSGAGLHHTIFAIDIRCHVITFEVTSRHPEVLESLTQQMNRVTLPPAAEEEGGGEFPVCIKDYASGNNLIHKVEPVDIGPRFTRVPARIIIDRQGRVKHVHVINAFPDQARSVQDALMQWTFKPYIQNGQPVEVETGILFEFGAHDRTHAGTTIIVPGAREGQSTTRKMP